MTLTQRETDREEEREGMEGGAERENKSDIRYQVGEKEDVGNRRGKKGERKQELQ